MPSGSLLRRRGPAFALVVMGVLGLAMMAPGEPVAPPDAERPPETQPGEPDEAAPKSLSDEELLAKLPDKWLGPDLLAQASIEINSLLAQAERVRALVPWKVAEGFRRSLQAGRTLAEQIPAETRVAYFQSLFISALAAGYPGEAMAAARELIRLDNRQPWNWLSVYRAGMALGDRAACDEAIDKLAEIVGPAGARALEPMKREAAVIGDLPAFSMPLSDGSEFSVAAARGKVVVFDFWAQTEPLYRAAVPLIRRLHDTFRGYEDFRMIGVNMDSREYRSVVQQFARANGMDWPHHFEGRVDRPISFKVFKCSFMPWQVVLSPSGKVIYAGRPNEPVLYYAIRGGLVEAAGGKIPTSRPDAAGPRKPPVASGPSDEPPGESPADKARLEKAAQGQLRLGEAFEAAGHKEKAVEIYKQVLARYPDTQAAVEAQTRLLRLER